MMLAYPEIINSEVPRDAKIYEIYGVTEEPTQSGYHFESN